MWHIYADTFLINALEKYTIYIQFLGIFVSGTYMVMT